MKASFSVSLLCKVMGVSASGFYKWRSADSSQRELENEDLATRIVEIHQASRGTYGRRRVRSTLAHQGVQVGKHRVARLMKMLGLQGLGRPRFKRTTRSGEIGALPNLLADGIQLNRKDQAWCSDITYVRTRVGWLYLCVVMDCWSRKVVGWAMADRMKSSLVTDALKAALTHRKPAAGLIFHSDKGSQYRSKKVRALAQAWGLRQSMTGKDHCYDNAKAESLFATLKKELIHRVTFKTREEAKTAIFEFVEAFYNRARAHSALGYLSPVSYEGSQS